MNMSNIHEMLHYLDHIAGSLSRIADALEVDDSKCQACRGYGFIESHLVGRASRVVVECPCCDKLERDNKMQIKQL
jgi:predicted Zn-ribbon and HTH transcriptional regulator